MSLCILFQIHLDFNGSSLIEYLYCAFKMYIMIANLIGFLMQALGMQLLKKTDRPEQKVILCFSSFRFELEFL